ncbi:hypothetical protein NA57DRAFT_62838 [Rhizodiscina lignyota]|uniref:Uncharacterized protein n=1 Tax=Rhizodiscina lignyota TaxID=1504668 RepID=A0A9P4IMB4_9PEZI|nr:hypothetical protein NA57DRAFT_62838 [Rhizodiscina lignyota]
MSTATEQIASAGPRNAKLLSVLAETDYAPAALKQQIAFIKDLQASLKQTDAHIAKLNQSVQKELKDHEKYRDSTVKRFAYRIGGKKEKFEEKASKEEREYFEAVIAQKAAEDERTMLRGQLEEAQKVKTQFESAVETHRQAQEELSELYEGIFAGPTPDFPEEDAKELPVYEAERRRDEIQTKLTRVSQAVNVLQEAQRAMLVCRDQMLTALDYSTYDIFGGGTFADLAERNALSRATTAAARAMGLVQQARRLDSNVQPFGPLQIAQGNFLSDVVFDNIFTDLAFHDKIKESAADVERASSRLTQQNKQALQRQEGLRKDMQASEKELKRARDELQKVRQDAFEKVAASHPPPYSEE